MTRLSHLMATEGSLKTIDQGMGQCGLSFPVTLGFTGEMALSDDLPHLTLDIVFKFCESVIFADVPGIVESHLSSPSPTSLHWHQGLT